MSTAKNTLKTIIKGKIPDELVENLVDEYIHIKQQFFLRRFQPAELNGSRFSECILRIIEFLNKGNYTAFGKQLDTEKIIRDAENSISLKDTIRFFIPRLTRVLLDIRNKRDVAHVGGEVNPNFSDSLFVVHATDWLLTEIVRHFHNCSIDEASKIVLNINEVKVPLVADIEGFIRVQSTKLSVSEKVLVILYYKNPNSVKDSDLLKWTRYQNSTIFKKKVLKPLDTESKIHYENGLCYLLPKGILFVDAHIPLHVID